MGKSMPQGGSGNVDYLSIKQGLFAVKLDPQKLPFDKDGDIPMGYRRREPFNPSTGKTEVVYEEVFGSVNGYITAISIEVPPFGGKQLQITLEDEDGEVNVVQMPLITSNGLGAYAKSFIQRTPDIDFGAEVTLQPYSIPRDDKPDKNNVGIVVKQYDEKLKLYFNRDNPAGIPEPVKSEDALGETTWDFSAHNRFLADKLKEFIDRLAEFRSNIPAAQQPAKEAEPKKELVGDDLPF